jgi:hypothetical protein
MNIAQKILFALVSGYVIAEMFRLPYNECMYVACMSATAPLILLKLKKAKR